jgi:hypothetical protein
MILVQQSTIYNDSCLTKQEMFVKQTLPTVFLKSKETPSPTIINEE